MQKMSQYSIQFKNGTEACACLDTRRVLVLIQVGVASLRRAKHTPRKTEKSKNENPKPSDAASHADPLSATAALTLSALLGFCSFLCRLYLAQGFFSLRFFFLFVKRICNVNLYTCIGQYTFGIASKYRCHTFVRVRKS